MQTCWSWRCESRLCLAALCLAWLCCFCVAVPYEAIRSDEIPHDCDIPVEWQGWYGCKETIMTRQRAPSIAVQSRVRAAISAFVYNRCLLLMCLQHKLQAARGLVEVTSQPQFWHRAHLRGDSLLSAYMHMKLLCQKIYCSKALGHQAISTDC